MNRAVAVCLGTVLLAPACRNAAPKTAEPIRLVDLYRPDPAAAAAARRPRPGRARGELRFTSAPPAPAAAPPAPAAARPGPPGAKPAPPAPPWEAGPGVSDLKAKDGILAGRSTAAIPIVHLRRPRSDDRDVLHEVQVRMRASAGANLAVLFRNTEEVDLKLEAENTPIIPWPLNSPLVAGEMRTYVLRTTAPIPMASRHVLIRPTDAAGASFEIESVRLVSRREHLAGIRAGMGWQGLGEVYRETLVAHAPDAMRFDVKIPARPRMQLAVGTVEPGPVTFTVSVQQGSTTEAIAQHTVTTPHRWETVKVDLERFAGRDVALSLAISAEAPGALGFWGSPVIFDAVAPASDRAGEPPQGVIFIWADTLRRDHLPFYGYSRPTAPVLARMASEGTLFEDSVAQASWTKASGPSMMTSLYPTSTGVQSFNDVLPSTAHTLAETFRQQGRATMALTSITFVGKFSNMHQGFEVLHESGALDRGGPLRLKTARPTVDRLLPWLGEHRDVPFYVLLHVADPHGPFKPEPPYDTLFADPKGLAEHERQMQKVQPLIRNANMRPRIMPTRDELVEAGIDPAAFIAYEKDWYDGSIRAMDAEIGRVVERLRELGLDRRTLIVFTSDHGEEFLEHGRTFHQQSAYGELANVPLFFWWPGRVPAGKRIPEMTQSIDIMPTLLELSGMPAPAGISGASLVPFLRGERNPAWPRPAITEAAGRMVANGEEDEHSFGIALDGWKLVHHPKRRAGRPEYELFDRRQDPLDQKDLAAQHPDIVARLTKELQAWRKTAESMRLKPDSQLAGTLSPDELERLRSLGYIQ
jgi:arylsulfatase A-like enzyme